MRAKRLMPVLLASGCALPVACTEDAFKSVSYDEARELAAKEEKLLFVDFYTTWCAPCKLMDSTTFTDKWVAKWLADKTVALKVDADREVALAQKYQVEVYPTLVFLKPDGSEFERLLGYVAAERFKRIALDLEQGVTTLDRARQEVKAHPDNPMAHVDLAQTLSAKGKHEEAFQEYRWCLDHGADRHPEFAELRDSLLVEELVRLSDSYEPAHKELLARRDAAERRIRQGKGAPADVALYAVVNRSMGEAKRTLDTYDSFMGQAASSEAVRLFQPYVFDALLEAKRYSDIAKTTDILGEVEQQLQAASIDSPAPGERPAALAEEIRQMQRQGAAVGLARYYEVLLALERTEDARSVARQVLAFDDSAETYNALAWAAYLSGKPLPENLEQARRAYELAGEDSVMILDTLVRVMHLLGRIDEAIAECEEGLRKAETEHDRFILQQCLSDFRAGSKD